MRLLTRQKYIFFVTFSLLTALLIFLNSNFFNLPPLGTLLDPFHGLLQQAEDTHHPTNNPHLQLPQLQDSATVLFDAQRHPHILAQNDHDAYFLQGYLSARDRLWQMDIQTRAAAGRISEILGPSTLEFDRKQRRKGIANAARKALPLVMADSNSASMLQAYTDGVNAFISSLSYKDYPVEFKLLNYSPENWSVYKSLLMLKYMADDLSGYSNDLPNTNARKTLGIDRYRQLYPDFPIYSPVIVSNEKAHYWHFNLNDLNLNFPIQMTPTDFHNEGSDELVPYNYQLKNQFSPLSISAASTPNPEAPNGSNNWAVGPSKTTDSSVILCGDPHLHLSLPSLWYEVQLNIKGASFTGASLPGLPGIIIGFNDSIAWSLTNSERDVRDWYHIEFKDATQGEYKLQGKWTKTQIAFDTISIKGKPIYIDTILQTAFGRVFYDRSFKEEGVPNNMAIRWMGEQASNEVGALYLLNRAQDYADFQEALQQYQCPAQNFLFAARRGDIGIQQQGKFQLLKQDEGEFIQEADTSSLVQIYIPFNENPHLLNPACGYVMSANQQPTDIFYPYFYSGDFHNYRALRIDEVLKSKARFNLADMMQLQNDAYNLWFGDLKNVCKKAFHNEDVFKHQLLRKGHEAFLGEFFNTWNQQNTRDNPYTALAKLWYEALVKSVYDDELKKDQQIIDYPKKDVVLRLNLLDSNFALIDNINTKKKENLRELLINSLDIALEKYDANANAKNWSSYRQTKIAHIAKLDAFGMNIQAAGELNSVNALGADFGASWRMIVKLSKNNIEAYGTYPGGASGNPGSAYYCNQVKEWEQGKYHALQHWNLNNRKDALFIQTFSK